MLLNSFYLHLLNFFTVLMALVATVRTSFLLFPIQVPMKQDIWIPKSTSPLATL